MAWSKGHSVDCLPAYSTEFNPDWEFSMTEERKHAILFAATILAARKLHELGDRPSPAREYAVSEAISNAELILRKIDQRWPQIDKAAD
jgi:hypothetical protein